MSPVFLNLLHIFLVFLLIGSVAMSLYLLYDMKSGNYRKFLSAGRKHSDLAERVQKVRNQNLGEEI